eukprot:g2314.t1
MEEETPTIDDHCRESSKNDQLSTQFHELCTHLAQAVAGRFVKESGEERSHLNHVENVLEVAQRILNTQLLHLDELKTVVDSSNQEVFYQNEAIHETLGENFSHLYKIFHVIDALELFTQKLSEGVSRVELDYNEFKKEHESRNPNILHQFTTNLGTFNSGSNPTVDEPKDSVPVPSDCSDFSIESELMKLKKYLGTMEVK